MEVRFNMLRPGQIRERRYACPVVYIPLGTLEWHGLHNPMGADALQAEYIAQGCAAKGGGVVFPTIYYGDTRAGSLLETDRRYVEGIADHLGVDKSLFSKEHFPYTHYQQIEHCQHHLVQILAEAASYGFQLAVFVVGHYPLLDHARVAILSYNQWCYDQPWSRMGVWAFSDFILLKDRYGDAGDHAGGWETSHLLWSNPETVNMELAQKPFQHGVIASIDPTNSSKEFGKEIYDAVIDAAVENVKLRLENPNNYNGHGMQLD